MIKNIHLYEMPVEESNRSFQIYEVKGTTIQNETYPHKTTQPHRHKYYEICIFINGAGKHEIDFSTIPIQSCSIHFITPGQVHRISREKNYHGYLLVFSRDFYLLDLQDKETLLDFPFFNNHSSIPVLNLPKEVFEEFLPVIEAIKSEYAMHREVSADIIRAYLHVFLLKSKHHFNRINLAKKVIDDPDYSLVSQFRMKVEKHFLQAHAVQDYAQMLSCTPVYLNKIIKKLTGMNANEIIKNRILLESKRLLMFTSLTNKEIAFKLGYEDPSYFSRIFRKKTGISPSTFREKQKIKA